MEMMKALSCIILTAPKSETVTNELWNILPLMKLVIAGMGWCNILSCSAKLEAPKGCHDTVEETPLLISNNRRFNVYLW